MHQVHFIGYDLDSRPRGSQPAGTVHFPPEMVRLEKLAGGVLLNVGYTAQLNLGVCASISNVTGELHFQGKQPSSTALGIALDPESHVINTGHRFPRGQAESMFRGCLRLPLNMAGLETIERLRGDGMAVFRLTVRGSAFVFDAAERTWDACMFQVNGGMALAAQVQVNRDHWIQQVRNVSPVGSVLVEIPLAVSRDAPWNAVWDQLDKASAHLAQGGEGGWEGCVAKVRQALELRAQIDKVTPGPAKADRDRDRMERLNDVAKALFHYCSLASHTDKHVTRWTRADAVLAFSALCGLLAARDP